MSDLEKLVKRLKGLKQNQDKTDDELHYLARVQLEKKEILGTLTFCIDAAEIKFASRLLNKYLEESTIESNSDKDTLRQLIDVEVILERIKSFLKTEYQKSSPAIPTHMLEELRKTNEQVISLKKELGLSSKDKQASSWVDDWNTLKKKALKYYETHKGCNTVKCPYCNKLFRLLMRVKDLEPNQETFFRGTILYNEILYKMYHDKRINKEEMAEIFGVSVDYIDRLYDGIYIKEREENK